MTDDDNILIQLRRTYGKDEMVSYVIRRISELKVELGQANSEIDHLNEEIKKFNLQGDLTREAHKEARREIKKEEMYKQSREEIINLRAKVKRLGKDNSELITKLLNK